VELGGIQGQSI